MTRVETRERVRRRSGNRCEYCLFGQDLTELPHQVEHIIARQHAGADDLDNLAFACRLCNLHKGPNVAGVDPVTGRIEPLFDPRRQNWRDHFLFAGLHIQGITAAGRVTVAVLKMNNQRRLEIRAELVVAARFPPPL